MDAARLAAKMALAHQGLDIKAQKDESKRSNEAEPYVPQFYTADESEEVEGNDEETEEEEVSVPEGAIWDLSSRSNKNSPKQEIGTAPNTSERHEEKIHVSSDDKDEEETIPVYRASGDEKVVNVLGEEKVWETMAGESAPGCPHAHMKVEEEMVKEETIDEITLEEKENIVEESEKPTGCPYSHKEL